MFPQRWAALTRSEIAKILSFSGVDGSLESFALNT